MVETTSEEEKYKDVDGKHNETYLHNLRMKSNEDNDKYFKVKISLLYKLIVELRELRNSIPRVEDADKLKRYVLKQNMRLLNIMLSSKSIDGIYDLYFKDKTVEQMVKLIPDEDD